MILPAPRRMRESPLAFTLAEIALSLGIVAGTALLALALFSSVSGNIQRLKEEEAPLRPAKTIDPAILRPHHPLPDSDETPAPGSPQPTG
ncbi:MAG: hypothetical protein RL693_567 [Verrucomicrobiota bacterium]|jgi:hypothetical protein